MNPLPPARSGPRLGHGDGTMAGDLGPEIAQAWPEGSGVQIDLGHRNGSPFLRVRDGLAGMVEDGGDHPVAGDRLVSAADEVDVIFAGAGAGEQRVAAPDGPGDDFRAAVAQLAGDFGEEAVVADHQAYFAEAGFKNRIVAAGRDAAVDLAAREAGFAVLAGDRAVGGDQGGGVV